jgi:hypothetical protein
MIEQISSIREVGTAESLEMKAPLTSERTSFDSVLESIDKFSASMSRPEKMEAQLRAEYAANPEPTTERQIQMLSLSRTMSDMSMKTSMLSSATSGLKTAVADLKSQG